MKYFNVPVFNLRAFGRSVATNEGKFYNRNNFGGQESFMDGTKVVVKKREMKMNEENGTGSAKHRR